MTDESSITVPATYIGQSDYVLTYDEHAEPFEIAASVDGRLIITGHDFRPPASGCFDPRDDPHRLASTFGAFLGAEVERVDYAERFPQYAEDGDPFDGWTIHDADADLDSLADACSMFGEGGST